LSRTSTPQTMTNSDIPNEWLSILSGDNGVLRFAPE
jgi:hypothetical protein